MKRRYEQLNYRLDGYGYLYIDTRQYNLNKKGMTTVEVDLTMFGRHRDFTTMKVDTVGVHNNIPNVDKKTSESTWTLPIVTVLPGTNQFSVQEKKVTCKMAPGFYVMDVEQAKNEKKPFIDAFLASCTESVPDVYGNVPFADPLESFIEMDLPGIGNDTTIIKLNSDWYRHTQLDTAIGQITVNGKEYDNRSEYKLPPVKAHVERDDALYNIGFDVGIHEISSDSNYSLRATSRPRMINNTYVYLTSSSMSQFNSESYNTSQHVSGVLARLPLADVPYGGWGEQTVNKHFDLGQGVTKIDLSLCDRFGNLIPDPHFEVELQFYTKTPNANDFID